MDPAKVQTLQQVWGAILVFYGIVAAAYWADVVEFSGRRERAKKEEDAESQTKAEKSQGGAEKLFKIATALAVVSIFCIALPVWFESEVVYNICRYTLVIPVGAITLLAVYYIATGKDMEGVSLKSHNDTLRE